MNLAEQEIIESELIEWLQAYDGPRFHAVLSDPPYALISITKRFGKDGSAPAQEGSDGRFSRLSGGFMGQKWDGFDSLEHYQTWVSEWAKLLIEKALHPGAVCLFFGGTRTYHHLGVGLERGGFEIMDCLMWFYGQGFPKSHDISKGMDKAAGVERAKIKGKTGPPNYHRAEGNTRPWMFEEDHQIDGPDAITSDAQIWDGYGTALKPAWEPIFLCRAPRGDKTFAQLAQEFGTGALNIDGSRVAGPKGKGVWGSSNETIDPDRKFNASPDMHGYKSQRDDLGRWPANFVLSHTDDCVKVGEFEIEGRTINRFTQGMMPFGNAKGEDYQSEQMPPETVERWACVQGCPVRMLDDQAGFDTPRPAKSALSGEGSGSGESRGLFGATSIAKIGYLDKGGPSRFFYTAKASRSEKDRGLEHFWWKRTDDGFERISLSEYEQLDKRERAHGCIHPTVKPLELLRYLATLSLPPKQDGMPRQMLIPFAGSGSEMIGAAQAGWDEVTGIEIEKNYIAMAEARLRANIGMF